MPCHIQGGDLPLSGIEGMGNIQLADNDLQILGTSVLSRPRIDLTSYWPWWPKIPS